MSTHSEIVAAINALPVKLHAARSRLLDAMEETKKGNLESYVDGLLEMAKASLENEEVLQALKQLRTCILAHNGKEQAYTPSAPGDRVIHPMLGKLIAVKSAESGCSGCIADEPPNARFCFDLPPCTNSTQEGRTAVIYRKERRNEVESFDAK